MIRLSTIQDVRTLVDIVTAALTDVDLSSGRYIVDGKSIIVPPEFDVIPESAAPSEE